MSLPERGPDDGPMSVAFISDDQLRIKVTNRGGEQDIQCSRYNAARVLVGLCMLLELPFPKALNKLKM